MTVNWDMPIQWADGTEAWVTEQLSENVRFVASNSEPLGWPGGALSMNGRNSVAVVSDGAVDSYPKAPKITNWEMPPLKTEDGRMVVAGSYSSNASVVLLRIEGERANCAYHWPSMKPFSGSPKLIEMDMREVEAASRIADDLARFEESDGYGLF